jgi:hypothetical protein
LRRRRAESGAAQVASALGIVIALVMLAMSLHVALALMTRSLVTTAAHDAAQLAATGRLRSASEVRAHLADLVGGVLVGQPEVSGLGPDDPTVIVRVHAKAPGFVGLGLNSVSEFDRTVIVRRERFTPDVEPDDE